MVIGPIANDTIFDTFGIITSGVLAPKESMQLLMIGPKYEQIALKSEKAAAQLKWLGRCVLSKDEVARYRAVVEAEQAEYQKLFAEAMLKLLREVRIKRYMLREKTKLRICNVNRSDRALNL